MLIDEVLATAAQKYYLNKKIPNTPKSIWDLSNSKFLTR